MKGQRIKRLRLIGCKLLRATALMSTATVMIYSLVMAFVAQDFLWAVVSAASGACVWRAADWGVEDATRELRANR